MVDDVLATTTRFYFTTLSEAGNALALVFEDARVTKQTYRFGGLSARAVLTNGLFLEGEIDDVVQLLEDLPGAVRVDE